MRAVCEACSQPQPRDWRPGDLCIHCGLAARQETRCFWCAKWTPRGKFCRKCGADVLEDPSLYGAARMLKDAGADRFAIPKMLREFDPERIEMFRAMYQSQAAIVAAHVADLQQIETFLHQRVWSAELEDRLTAELPWPEGQGFALPRYDDSDRLAQIAKFTPVALTAQLAAIALYSRGQWKQQPEVIHALHNDDPRIAQEAALALSHWRALIEVGIPRDAHRTVENQLLQGSLHDHANVRLAALSLQEQDAVLLASPDPDIRFAAALNLRDAATLRAVALDTSAPKAARHAAMLRLDLDAQVAAALGGLDGDQIVSVADAMLRTKQAYPLLADALLALMRASSDARVRNRLARVLSKDISHETAVAVFNVDPNDRETAMVLLRANLRSETFEYVGSRLIDQGEFSTSMYGMDNAAKPGHMPEGFVPAHYARAGAQRPELIRFAEHQLEDRDCEPLKDFLIRQCFEDRGAAQHAAWGSMSRLCRRESYQAVCPFQLEANAVDRIFGSMGAFLRSFLAFFRDPDWRKDVIIWDPADKFLYYASEQVWPSIAAADAADDLVEALVERIDSDTMSDISFFNAALIGLAAASPRMRPGIEQHLRRIARNLRFQYSANYALERIVQLTGRPADTQ